jgi:hypothetical protein
MQAEIKRMFSIVKAPAKSSAALLPNINCVHLPLAFVVDAPSCNKNVPH